MSHAQFTPKVLQFESLESTNLKARELAMAGAAEGTVVIAGEQGKGRGSGKRVWHSPKGGLYVSVLLYPKKDRRPTDLAILAGAAMAQAVKEILPKAADVSLKWPNDCLIGWKKVGGILCESLGEEYGNFCVLGIGLNINIPKSELEPFLQNPFSATSFQIETGGEFPVSQVAQILLRKLFALYGVYQEHGFENIRFIWEKNCHLIGKRVELKNSGWRENPLPEGQKGVLGTFEGIDEHGGFVLSNSRGERRGYVTGEITCFWP